MSDSIVALLIVLMHGTVIMCQGMAFSVAMNSKRSSALVALLIASNFVEIKGKPGPCRRACVEERKVYAVRHVARMQ